MLRQYYEHPAITTDVIVGFPGETAEEFAETCAFVKKVDFYEVHVFKYSKRNGTVAASMPDQIPEEVNAGDRLQIPVQLVNVGRGMVYNARCTVDVPGLQTDKSLFLGNIEGGTAVSGELDAFAGVVNAEEETTEKRYGRTGGRILLTYEDEDGNSYEETSDIVLTIQPLKIEEKNTDKNGKESNKIGRQFLIGVTAVVGLGIAGVVLPGWIRRRKQGQFYE